MNRKRSLALLGLAVCLGAVPSPTDGFGIKASSSWPGFDDGVDFWPDIDEDLWRSPLGVNLDEWPRFSILGSDSFLRRPSPNEQRCRWKPAVDRATEIGDEEKNSRHSAEDDMGRCGGEEVRQRRCQGNRFESESESNDAGHWNQRRCGGESDENLEYSRRHSENSRKLEAEIERLRNEQRMLKEQEEKYNHELDKLKKKQKELQEAVKHYRRDEQMEGGSRRDMREEKARLRREQEERLRREELMRMQQEEEARQRHDEALRRQRREEEARQQSRLRLEEEERARREDRVRREKELEEQQRRHEEWVRQERQRREEEHEKSRRIAQQEQRRNEELRLAEIQRQLKDWDTVTEGPYDGSTHDFYAEPQKRSDFFILDIPKDYYPDELSVKTEGHHLKIKGTQFCKCEDGCVYKEFERSLSLPRTIGTDNLSATLDSHGRLRIDGYRYSQDVLQPDRTVSVRGLGIPNSSGRTKCAKPQRGVNIRTSRNTLKKPKAYEFDEVTGTYDSIDDDGVTVEDEL